MKGRRRKAHVLIEQGYNPAIDGEAYASVFFPELRTTPSASPMTATISCALPKKTATGGLAT